MIYLFLLCTGVFFSCDRGDVEFADFDDLEGADYSAFKVMSSRVTDLSGGLPEDCAIPVEDTADTKTTSTTIPSVVADLFDYGNKNKVLEIAGIYESIDINTGKDLKLSGKILLPKGRKPKRYIVVSHYTIGSNAEAPSNCFPLEGILCDLGYAMIFPDYQGYGVDAHHIHPYLVLHQTALDVYLMYDSVNRFLKNTKYNPEYEDIYLMGYSQGGAVTMAVQWLIEEIADYVKIRQVFAGGGPYDVRATYNNFITSNTVNIPAAIPMVIQGMIVGNGLDLKASDFLQPWICDKLDEWINSKKYTVDQLKRIIGTTKSSDILTEQGMDETSEIVSELYKALSANSILAFNWTPRSPVYMLHSMEDDVVPYINASKAKSKWTDANIQYNFGYYGSHLKTALRFIYSVQTWLKNEGE